MTQRVRRRADMGALAQAHMPRNVLGWIPALKLRLMFIIVAAIGITIALFYVGVKWLALWPATAGLLAGIGALASVWVLSQGTLEPLRDMASASESIARGDFDTRVVANSRDEIGRLAVSFNAMAEELAHTDRVRRDLVANVSHELRTPLASLQAKLENIADGVESADPATIATMLAQTERLGRLVKQLLDLSRLESGTVPLDRRTFEVAPMLELAAREARLANPAAVINVNVMPLGLAVDGDAERLHQVVANLVENAVRYSPSTTPVDIVASATHHTASIEVIDRGPGIASADAERVFERFYRADASRASSAGGAGLGLAIARWIVELHGGTIRIHDAQPHGCRMVVTLPHEGGATATRSASSIASSSNGSPPPTTRRVGSGTTECRSARLSRGATT